VALGNPFALGSIDREPTATVGIVSARNLNVAGAFDAVMTDTPINPGNSGGPLLNLDGELVGINGQIATRHGVKANTGCGYAVSSNQLKRYLPALKGAEGKVVRAGAMFGISMKGDELEPATIARVDAGSTTEKAGFKPNDVFVSLEGVPVRTPVELAGLLRRWPAGTDAAFVVKNDATPRQIKYRLDVPRMPFVGLMLDPKKPKEAAVAEVAPDSPAAKAGLKVGDVIEQLGPIAIKDIRLLPAMLSQVAPGSELELKVRRGQQTLTLKLVVGSIIDPPGGGRF